MSDNKENGVKKGNDEDGQMVDAEELTKLEDKVINGAVPSDDDDDSDEHEVSDLIEEYSDLSLT